MTNKEKAKELGQKYFHNEHNIWARQNYEAQYVESACLEITEWKEQQMIEKACEWLKDQACYYSHWEVNGDTYEDEIVVDSEKMIEDFKKAMEE